jgi:hypothetical protein
MIDHFETLRAACSAATPAGINMDGLVSLLLWVIGIGATLIGAKIIFRSDRQSPRQTGNTVLNLGVGAVVIVFFLGSATIWTTMGGVRDVVLRGGASASGSNGAC